MQNKYGKPNTNDYFYFYLNRTDADKRVEYQHQRGISNTQISVQIWQHNQFKEAEHVFGILNSTNLLI